jgi:hypothetical protein
MAVEYYDNGVRFGTGHEMIAEIRRLRLENQKLAEEVQRLVMVASHQAAEISRPREENAKLRWACKESLEQLSLLAKDPETNWWCRMLRDVLAGKPVEGWENLDGQT